MAALRDMPYPKQTASVSRTEYPTKKITARENSPVDNGPTRFVRPSTPFQYPCRRLRDGTLDLHWAHQEYRSCSTRIRLFFRKREPRYIEDLNEMGDILFVQGGFLHRRG